jgi:hypothetical protein
MSRAVTLLAVALAVACKGPEVPSPLTGEMRYTCCNMHYEKTEISDVNYQRGTLIPLGTRVQIVEVRRNSVKFLAPGHPEITLVQKYGRKTITMEEYLQRLFLPDDPRSRLPVAPVARKGKPAPASDADKIRKDIETGAVESGMTRDQVLMALGYPPAHRTPSLQSPTWTYWENRWATFEVVFDGDRVSRVNR